VLPLAAVWAFLILVPLYYEARFGLFLGAPIALFAVTAASAGAIRGRALRRPIELALLAVALTGVGLSLRTSQRLFVFETPIRAYDAAGALIRKHPEAPGGVCARKPHISFAADRRLVGFPETTLGALPDSLRARGAAFLFYGPAELELVPRYAALIDPASIPPGLRLVRVESGLQFGLLFQVLPSNVPSPVSKEMVQAMKGIDDALRQNGIWDRVRRRLATDAIQNGSFLISRGRFAEAVEPLEQFVTLFPDVPDGHRLLGWADVDLGKPVEGLAHLDRAAALGGPSSEIAVNRARALLLLERTVAADSALDQALSRWPDVADLVVLKGYTSYHLGKEEEARRWWSEAERRWPNDPRAKNYLEAMERDLKKR
jgi:Flp pilus assembly protein TadD